MALPATANFTGTNGTKIRTLTDWDGCNAGGTGGALAIATNVADADVSNQTQIDWWTSDSFNAAQYSEATVAEITSGVYVGVGVHLSGTDNDGASSLTGYLFYSDSADGCYIDEYSGGSYVASIAGPGATFSVSDVIRLEIDGSGNLVGKINGVTELSVTDTSIASGAAGICAYGHGASGIDDWEGGNLSTGITGTLSKTLGAATLAATGEIDIAGTLSKTLGAATLAATGELDIAGTLSVTLGAATLAATGTLGGAIEGALDVTLGAATLAATGELDIAGTLSVTLGAATLAATGSGGLTGTLSVTLGAATVASTGELDIAGAASVTLGAATLSANSYILTDACVNGVLTVNATNARYFENDNGPLVLAGFHTWYDVQDGGATDPPPVFDWDEYLAALVSYGCNFTKLWRLETPQDWGGGFADEYMAPMAYPRTGTSTAADGKPQFDLDAWDHTYFQRLHERAIEAGNAGIYVCVQLFQGWHIDDKSEYGAGSDPWAYHPFEAGNNSNSVDGDINDDGSGFELRDTSQTALYNRSKAFVDRVIDTLNHLDNVIWEISNEDTYSSAAETWQSALVDYIHTYEAGKAKQHPVGMTKFWPSGDDAYLEHNNEWASYDTATADAVADGTYVSMYDTDHTVGIATDYSWAMEAFTNGHGGAWYMDQWDGGMYGTDTRETAARQLIRSVTGYVLDYAAQMDLENATPQPSLSETGYCLANTTVEPKQIFAYQDGTGAFDLYLTGITGTFAVEWLRISDGTTQAGTDVEGGATRTLTPPWSGAVAAFLLIESVTGTLDVTLGAATLAATGELDIAGATDATLGEATLTATGEVDLAGALDATLGALTLAAVGYGGVTGGLSATLGAATLAATGELDIAGALSATLGAATLAATGVLDIAGSTTVTLGAVAVAATGTLAISGSAIVTLAVMSLAAVGGSVIATPIYGTVKGPGASGTVNGPDASGTVRGPGASGTIIGA